MIWIRCLCVIGLLVAAIAAPSPLAAQSATGPLEDGLITGGLLRAGVLQADSAGENLAGDDALENSWGETSLAPRILVPSPLSVGGPAGEAAVDPAFDFALGGPERWTSPEGLTGSLQIVLLLTVLSMAPAVLLMTTCYVRIIIVLGLLRQALGLQSLPPSQVMTSIALFITLFVMTPVWNEVYHGAIKPYTEQSTEMTGEEAWEAGTLPIRQFMSRQIQAAENHDDINLFFHYANPGDPLPETWGDVPIRVLLPAFMLSELKTAFLMGFQIYLPFLIVDLVVASVTISMGMLMLPPAVISLPFKLLLFVLVDGWRLVVEMLLTSFGTLPLS